MRIFASPSRYIQGENALFENAKSILDLGITINYIFSWTFWKGIYFQQGKNKIIIDLSELNTGIYFCKIKTTENLQLVKLIKN